MICILQVFQSHELTNFNHWQIANDFFFEIIPIVPQFCVRIIENML